jgi:hypothetical protein
LGAISAFTYRHRETKKTQGNQKDTGKPRRHRETKKTQGNQENTGKPKRHRETKKTQGNQELEALQKTT